MRTDSRRAKKTLNKQQDSHELSLLISNKDSRRATKTLNKLSLSTSNQDLRRAQSSYKQQFWTKFSLLTSSERMKDRQPGGKVWTIKISWGIKVTGGKECNLKCREGRYLIKTLIKVGLRAKSKLDLGGNCCIHINLGPKSINISV